MVTRPPHCCRIETMAADIDVVSKSTGTAETPGPLPQSLLRADEVIEKGGVSLGA
jgi:hypothetical protein